MAAGSHNGIHNARTSPGFRPLCVPHCAHPPRGAPSGFPAALGRTPGSNSAEADHHTAVDGRYRQQTRDDHRSCDRTLAGLKGETCEALCESRARHQMREGQIAIPAMVMQLLCWEVGGGTRLFRSSFSQHPFPGNALAARALPSSSPHPKPRNPKTPQPRNPATLTPRNDRSRVGEHR